MCSVNAKQIAVHLHGATITQAIAILCAKNCEVQNITRASKLLRQSECSIESIEMFNSSTTASIEWHCTALHAIVRNSNFRAVQKCFQQSSNIYAEKCLAVISVTWYRAWSGELICMQLNKIPQIEDFSSFIIHVRQDYNLLVRNSLMLAKFLPPSWKDGSSGRKFSLSTRVEMAKLIIQLHAWSYPRTSANTRSKLLWLPWVASCAKA